MVIRNPDGARSGMSIARVTLEKIEDEGKFQKVDINLSHGEKKTGVEVFHPYGMSAVPLPPSGSGKKKERAEAMVIFPDGNRSHGMVIPGGDRRHRKKGMKPGEVALHDDQGHEVHLGRDGLTIKGPKKITLNFGGSTIVMEQGGDVRITPGGKVYLG